MLPLVAHVSHQAGSIHATELAVLPTDGDHGFQSLLADPPHESLTALELAADGSGDMDRFFPYPIFHDALGGLLQFLHADHAAHDRFGDLPYTTQSGSQVCPLRGCGHSLHPQFRLRSAHLGADGAFVPLVGYAQKQVRPLLLPCRMGSGFCHHHGALFYRA